MKIVVTLVKSIGRKEMVNEKNRFCNYGVVTDAEYNE
jgi:hypothetical protein